MWTARGLLLLLVLGACAVGAAVYTHDGRQKRKDMDVTLSQTISITGTVDANTLPAGAFPPGPKLPPGWAQGGGGSPLLPPEPPGGSAVPTAEGDGGEELEGGLGGHKGDRCPDTMKDEHGNFPAFCDDVMDEEGSCLLDDIVAPKEQCILWYGQDFYDELMELQKEIENNRTEAIQNADSSSSTQAPLVNPEGDIEEDVSPTAEGKSIEALAPARRQSRFSERAYGIESRDLHAGLANLNVPQLPPRLSEVVRRDGPSFSTDALNSLGYLETQQVGPTLGYFESLWSLERESDSRRRQQRSGGPQMNTGALNNLGYLETQQVGPTLGYFQSLSSLRRLAASPAVDRT